MDNSAQACSHAYSAATLGSAQSCRMIQIPHDPHLSPERKVQQLWVLFLCRLNDNDIAVLKRCDHVDLEAVQVTGSL